MNNNNNIDDDDAVDDDATGDAVGSLIAASVHLQRDATESSSLLMGGVSPELTEEQNNQNAANTNQWSYVWNDETTAWDLTDILN